MTPRTLIVLFGHENTTGAHPALKKIAQLRCDAAVEALRSEPDAVLLPTGAFGRHFNSTGKPHWLYLTEYLWSKGVSPSKILQGTNSSNTYEDCLCARRVFVDGGFEKLIAVTSDYHVPRVKFILCQMLAPTALVVRDAATPDADPAVDIAVVLRKEEKQFRQLRKNWIAPPDYTGGGFPKVQYDEAASEHHHYDTMSLAVVSAMFVVAAFPLVTMRDSTPLTPKLKAASFIAAATIDACLLLIYWRAAYTASLARAVLRNFEIAYGCRGFSANYDPRQHWTPPMLVVVLAVGLGLVAAAVLAGALASCRRPGFACALELSFLLGLIPLALVAVTVLVGTFCKQRLL